MYFDNQTNRYCLAWLWLICASATMGCPGRIIGFDFGDAVSDVSDSVSDEAVDNPPSSDTPVDSLDASVITDGHMPDVDDATVDMASEGVEVVTDRPNDSADGTIVDALDGNDATLRDTSDVFDATIDRGDVSFDTTDASFDRLEVTPDAVDAPDIPDVPPPDLSCPTGRVRCTTACVDLQTDLGHCGRCGRTCATSCVSGGCLTTFSAIEVGRLHIEGHYEAFDWPWHVSRPMSDSVDAEGEVQSFAQLDGSGRPTYNNSRAYMVFEMLTCTPTAARLALVPYYIGYTPSRDLVLTGYSPPIGPIVVTSYDVRYLSGVIMARLPVSRFTISEVAYFDFSALGVAVLARARGTRPGLVLRTGHDYDEIGPDSPIYPTGATSSRPRFLFISVPSRVQLFVYCAPP